MSSGSRAVVAVLDPDPDLAEGLSEEQQRIARMRALAEVLSYEAGAWQVGPEDIDGTGKLGLLLVEGLMTREVTVGDYTCAELLGPGDVLQPWLRIGPDHSVASEVDWDIVEPARLAVLGREFVTRIAPWPEITAAVARRVMQRAHWLAFHLAVCGLRRIDDRLLIVLWHFADRWGTVTPEGVKINVRLTHDVLAAVIGARRPSVTTALRRLADQDRIRPRPKSRWLLLGSPPPELQAVHDHSRPKRKRRGPMTDCSSRMRPG